MVRRWFGYLLTCLVYFSGPVRAEDGLVLIRAEAYLDVRRGELVAPAHVIVEDGLIKEVNPDVVPEGTPIIDLGSRVLLPGLMDMHTHLTDDYFTGDEWVTRPVLETAADYAIRGVVFAEKTLMAGFTTVRNVGALPGFADIALARAIERDFLSGPDMWTAGHYISTSGGHCDITGFAPGVMELGPDHGIADGQDAVRHAVRYQAKHGASVIKVCAGGGVYSNSRHAPVGAQQYSQEELDVIVAEAARLGLRVAAHAHGTDAINAAVRAGVASIEHGSILSQESIELMKANGTFLVPNAYLSEIPLPPDTPEATVEKNAYLIPLSDRSIRMAYEAGVNMALGSDAGVYQHGLNGRELSALVRRGLPEVHVLRMATLFAAELLGVEDRGVIEPGRRADMIGVDGDPLVDIGVVESVSFVMKGGRIYKGP
ncbi:MAG: amidohydrolase family protein [Xanthomonadales bacterium]|nr:amidohydrolase family protein [Xanthomonadales bacterium]